MKGEVVYFAFFMFFINVILYLSYYGEKELHIDVA